MLDWTDGVLDEFSGWFKGKTSPVHLTKRGETTPRSRHGVLRAVLHSSAGSSALHASGTRTDLGTQLQRKRSQIASYSVATDLSKNLPFTRDFGPVREVWSQD